jgi:hypothetical protein
MDDSADKDLLKFPVVQIIADIDMLSGTIASLAYYNLSGPLTDYPVDGIKRRMSADLRMFRNN